MQHGQPEVSRLDLSTRRRTPYLRRGQAAAGLSASWTGFRLQHWSIPGPIEVEESSLDAHVIVLNVGDPIHGYVKYTGERGGQRVSQTGMIGVTPALHPYVTDCQACDVLTVAIQPSLLSELALASHRQVTVEPIVEADAPLIREAMLALAEDVRAGSPFGATYGEALCATIAAELLRRSNTTLLAAERAGLGAADRQHVLRFIEEHLSEQLRLSDLAVLVGMTTSTFCRAFKASVGQAPHSYILHRRFERAKELLLDGRISLAQVALACGFASQSHLSDVFTRLAGHPPGRYRSLLGRRSGLEH